MTWTLVQSQTNLDMGGFPQVTLVVTLGSAIAAGDLLAIYCGEAGDPTVGTAGAVADDLAGGGNAYSHLLAANGGQLYTGSGVDQGAEGFYTIVTKSGTPNITWTPEGLNGRAFVSITVDHYTGSDAASVLHKSAGQHQSNPGATTDIITSGAQTTTVDGCLVTGGCVKPTAAQGTLVHGTTPAFTSASSINSSVEHLSEYLAQASQGSIAAKYSDSNGGSNDYLTIMMVFTPAAGGGGGGPNWNELQMPVNYANTPLRMRHGSSRTPRVGRR